MRHILGIVVVMIALVAGGAARAQAPVRAMLPANGSLNASGCGPFGVVLDPGVLGATDDALVVRGSVTGLRTDGTLHVSAAGDTLTFSPLVPFVPGETVTVTLRGSLTRGGVPVGAGRVWTCRIAPDEAMRAASASALQSETVALTGALAGGFEHLDAAWADLDGDLDTDGVLLAQVAGVPYLALVTQGGDPATGTVWQPRSPAVVTIDNPVALLAADLDDDARRDLVLLGLAGLQVWHAPGAQASPAGGAAAWIALPAGFTGRGLVAGDVDGDGDQDVVVIGLFGAAYVVLLNDGAGLLTAQPPVTIASSVADAAKALPWAVLATLADLDQDGNLDLAWTADFEVGGRYAVQLAAGRGDGTFAASGVLADREVFPRGLVFGRTVEASDAAPLPQLLVALPDRGDANLCPVNYDGMLPGASIGCLTGPGLDAGAGAVQAGHLLLNSGGDASVPEIWYADPVTGDLVARPLAAGAAVQTVSTGGGVAAVNVGDIDYDGDGDVVVVQPAAGRLVVLSTPGGLVQAPPEPVGIVCGDVFDFGAHELGCGEVFGEVTFTNPGSRPARIASVTIADAAGVFRVVDQPTGWFGAGCAADLASASLQLGFLPADRQDYAAVLTVRLTWAGAAADGGDSTLICGLTLAGSGGVFGLTAGPAGPGLLTWNGTGYTTAGGAFDLGYVTAEAGVVADTTVTLTNTGDFAVDVTPPAAPDAPWSVDPLATVRLLPGATAAWTVRAQPHEGLLPAGVDTLAVAASLAWTVEPVDPLVCFAGAVLDQQAAATLVRLLRPDLAVLDVQLLPLPGDAVLREGRPFLAQAIVTVRRTDAPGAVITLDGGAGACGVAPAAAVVHDLAEDRLDTVTFTITPCGDNLSFPVGVCAAPAEGMAYEYDPVDNCFTAGARLAANAAPVITFSNLVLNPADPTLEPCDPQQTWNTIDGGQLAAMGVREGGGVSVTVRADDAEGDALRLEAANLPSFVTVVRVSDAEVQLSAAPPVGTVVTSACALFGPLVARAFETATADPESTTVAVPLYVRWDGPDLMVSLQGVPASAEIGQSVRFTGSVRNVGSAPMGSFEIAVWLTDGDDLRVGGRSMRVGSLAPGASYTVPQILYEPQMPGRFCAHVAILDGRDLDPANNTLVQCFPVHPGALVVSPNVATPNGDGLNDRILFHMNNQDVGAPRLRVYELSGALVYESSAMDPLRNLWWDGSDKSGRLVPPGSYLYVIDDGGREVGKGVCGVIR